MQNKTMQSLYKAIPRGWQASVAIVGYMSTRSGLPHDVGDMLNFSMISIYFSFFIFNLYYPKKIKHSSGKMEPLGELFILDNDNDK